MESGSGRVEWEAPDKKSPLRAELPFRFWRWPLRRPGVDHGILLPPQTHRRRGTQGGTSVSVKVESGTSDAVCYYLMALQYISRTSDDDM